MEQKKDERSAPDMRRDQEAFAKMVERLTGKPCNPADVLVDYDNWENTREGDKNKATGSDAASDDA